jgi:hypothetical protein
MHQSPQTHHHALLSLSSVVFFVAVLWSMHSWLQRVTAPAPRPHAVLRLNVFGRDLGADAWPPQPGAAGYVEVWTTPPDGDYQLLLQLPGAPALPLKPLRPAPPMLEA